MAGGRLIGRVLRIRWLVRAPIAVYRAGFGWVFGRRLVMIEHLGRASGRPRYVVVEVVDRTANRIRVPSGFGREAQWYRNLRANGVAYLSTGRARRVAAGVRFLSEAQSAEALRDYSHRHPFAWKVLGSALTHLSRQDVVPIVEFVPPAASTATSKHAITSTCS